MGLDLHSLGALQAVMFACKSAAAVLLAAAIIPLLVTARLSADVVPSNVTASGEDWCQPLAPCNQPKASVESFLDVAFGLIPKASSGTEKYEYADVTPAAAVDWRKVLTNWTIRDQGTCGRVQTAYCTYVQPDLRHCISAMKDHQ